MNNKAVQVKVNNNKNKKDNMLQMMMIWMQKILKLSNKKMIMQTLEVPKKRKKCKLNKIKMKVKVMLKIQQSHKKVFLVRLKDYGKALLNQISKKIIKTMKIKLIKMDKTNNHKMLKNEKKLFI